MGHRSSIMAVTIQRAPIRHARKQSRATSMRRTIKPVDRPTRIASKLEIFLISGFFSLLISSAIIIAMLFIQVKDLKVEISQIQRTTMARLDRVEKVAEQRIFVKEPAISETQPKHVPFALSEADRKLIRQFIKTLPSKPGAQQKIHIGDKISGMPLVPVPESLVARLPKLRGARFSIDQNGAIVIIGEGSSHADAVIAPN